jgi:hypothetical protein
MTGLFPTLNDHLNPDFPEIVLQFVGGINGSLIVRSLGVVTSICPRLAIPAEGAKPMAGPSTKRLNYEIRFWQLALNFSLLDRGENLGCIMSVRKVLQKEFIPEHF